MIIYEITRCLFHQSYLPTNIWSWKTIKTTCYLLNHHITKSVKHQCKQASPRRKQDDFHLHNLACSLWVHVHILVHQCGKMDAKTSRCILLGWDDYIESYHCYCPSTHEIIISRIIVIHQKHCYHKISNFKNTWNFFKSMHICTNAWLGIFFFTNTYWDIVYAINLVSRFTTHL